MEHNIENIIRRKVLEHESRPVYWNKERVQQAIIVKTSAGKAGWFYAAASLTFAIGLGYLIVTRNINSVHNTSENLLLTNQVSPKLPDNSEETEIIIKEKTVIRHLSIGERKYLKRADCNTHITTDTVKSTIPIKHPLDVTKGVIRNDSIALISDNEPGTRVEPVHAIFGIEEEKYFTIKLKRGKRIRVRIFSAKDEMHTTAVNEASTNLLAPFSNN